MSQPHAADPTLIGRYEIRHKLGEGGMGVVYAAHDPELEREVAVKLLRPDRLRKGRVDGASERLQHEARVTARLAHPNVVTIYDVGKHEGSVYVAMELVNGPSLRRWMQDVARPWREVATMFFQAGLGLAAAHEAGLIHRDFKPSNVLIGDRRARVVDFGLAHVGAARAGSLPRSDADVSSTAPSESSATRPAMAVKDVIGTMPGPEDTTVTRTTNEVLSTSRAADSRVGVTITGGDNPTTVSGGATTTGQFVGTPAYMAPELFTGGIADARSDQFAFCVSLYEGLYGERPFSGDTAAAIAEQVLAGNVRVEQSRTRVPGWMREIIVRGLARDPDERHPSIRSMLASIAFVSRIMYG